MCLTYANNASLHLDQYVTKIAHYKIEYAVRRKNKQNVFIENELYTKYVLWGHSFNAYGIKDLPPMLDECCTLGVIVGLIGCFETADGLLVLPCTAFGGSIDCW